jgi:adenylate cyclase
MAPISEFEAAGLYDAVVDADTTRLDLLRWLEGLGFTVAEMKQANDFPAMGLTALASDRRLLGGELLAGDEALEMSGLTAEDFEEYVNAVGLVALAGAPQAEVALTSDDAAMLARLSLVGSIFSREEAMALVRVIGSSVARIAEASVSLFLQDIEAPHVKSGWDELRHAQQTYDAVGLLDDELGVQLGSLLRRHTIQAAERTRNAAMGFEDGFDFRFAVGFVDLVGFTSVSAKMSPQELGVFLLEFEGRSHEVVTNAGARVIKLIGDEVMFVSTNPDSACRAAAALMSGFKSATDHVVPRGGVAYGNVLLRGGDYFGQVVNLASRLVSEALPQEILVTDELAAAATECEFVRSGQRVLKGFDEPVSVNSFLAG